MRPTDSTYPYDLVCDTCNGRGTAPAPGSGYDGCYDCHGAGTVRELAGMPIYTHWRVAPVSIKGAGFAERAIDAGRYEELWLTSPTEEDRSWAMGDGPAAVRTLIQMLSLLDG